MNNQTTCKVIDILLVEDNPDDVELTLEALKDVRMINTIYVVIDGAQAIEFLRKKGQFNNAVRPDLILLDLNLPKRSGPEVLAEVKTDPDLKSIPVVILTMSEDEEDILKAYNLHANCYINKPVDLNQFIKVVRTIEDFWLGIVKLPPKRR